MDRVRYRIKDCSNGKTLLFVYPKCQHSTRESLLYSKTSKNYWILVDDVEEYYSPEATGLFGPGWYDPDKI